MADRRNRHPQWRLPRDGWTSDHEAFRGAVAEFVRREIVPHNSTWEEAGIVDRNVFVRAGRAGYLGLDVPTQFGGAGIDDFRYNAIWREEAARQLVASSAARIALHNDVCVPYLLDASDAQQQRWLPGVCAGTTVLAIAMTEPGAGSDLSAIRTKAVKVDGGYLLNGAKTMISNALNCDMVIVACRTDTDTERRSLTLLAVNSTSPGFRRGRPFKKAGQASSDLAELFFDDVFVPNDHLLGTEGDGFSQLLAKLPRERISIALDAVAQAEAALELTRIYIGERTAFGQPIGSFQHNRFAMAEMRTEIDIARVFVDRQITALNAKQLSQESAAEAKWWCTEVCKRVVDQCLQLHGGYGYMEEYAISRAWRDARAMTIYGGTTEIMKEIVGRGLGL